MHAKMIRDRKKCFIKTVQSTIDELEHENARLRSLLAIDANDNDATDIENKQTPSSRKWETGTMIVTPELSAARSPASTTSHGFILE